MVKQNLVLRQNGVVVRKLTCRTLIRVPCGTLFSEGRSIMQTRSTSNEKD